MEIQWVEDVLALFIYFYNLECSQSPALKPCILSPHRISRESSARLGK
jgi:hypothetical protein